MDRELFLSLMAHQKEVNLWKTDVSDAYERWIEAQEKQKQSQARLSKLQATVRDRLNSGRIVTMWVDGVEYAIHPEKVEIYPIVTID